MEHSTPTIKKTIRSFIGIGCDDLTQHRIAPIIEELTAKFQDCKIRFTPLANLHLTIRFLGQTDTSLLPTLETEMRNAVTGFHPFCVQTDKLTYFPRKHHPRIIALTIRPDQHLTELANRFNDLALQLGFPPEKHAFNPHITLGRIKSAQAPTPAIDISTFEVNIAELSLFESVTEPEGAVYKPRVTLPFAD